MLILEEIVFQANKPFFTQKKSKIIKFSYNTFATSGKSDSIFINQSQIRWSQNIPLPILYNKNIDFQICDKHNFGYNPEELKQIMKGKIKIQKGKTFLQSEVFDQNNLSIGKIQIKLRSNSIISQKIGSIMPKNQRIIIKSLVAYLPQLTNKKAYISIKIGDVHKQTPLIKSNGGQLVFTEGWDLQKSSFIKEAAFDVFYFEEKINQIKLMASGTLSLQDYFLQRSIALKDARGDEVGNLYLTGKIFGKRMSKQQKIVSTPQKFSTIDVGKLNRYQQYLQDSKNQLLRNSTNNSVDLSKISSTESSIHMLSFSKVSNSLSRIKKIKILQENGDVFFPKEQRFKLYQDKQSSFISYLNQRDDLTLKQKHSGRFYRGASIGYGQKTDFASRGSPGVGKYKLPSIWDRY